MIVVIIIFVLYLFQISRPWNHCFQRGIWVAETCPNWWTSAASPNTRRSASSRETRRWWSTFGDHLQRMRMSRMCRKKTRTCQNMSRVGSQFQLGILRFLFLAFWWIDVWRYFTWSVVIWQSNFTEFFDIKYQLWDVARVARIRCDLHHSMWGRIRASLALYLCRNSWTLSKCCNLILACLVRVAAIKIGTLKTCGRSWTWQCIALASH